MTLKTRRLVVVGAGGHGRVVADAARAAGFQVLAFADRALAGRQVGGVPVLDADVETLAEMARRQPLEAVVAIGANASRQRVQLALQVGGVQLATVVHPAAVLLGGARVEKGSVVLARALLGVEALVGPGAIVNAGAILEHDGQLGAFAHLSPGVATGGEVRVGEGAHLGVGVSVRNGISIGAWSVIGVGAAVVSDIPEGAVAYGVPARVVRSSVT